LLYQGSDCTPSSDNEYYSFEKKLRDAYGTGAFKNISNYSEYQTPLDMSTLEAKALITAKNNSCNKFKYTQSDIFPISCGNSSLNFENYPV